MRLRDIPECGRIVASHPTLGPRYGAEIANVCAVWRRLFANEWYFTSAVFEEVEGTRVRVLGAGLAAFVSDDFLQEAKNPPSFWLGPEISKRVTRGDSPLLTEKQVAEANSRDGLNLFVLQSGLNPEHFGRPEAHVVGATAFVEDHRGFRLKETFAQAESADHLAGLLKFGTLILGATEEKDLGSDQARLQQIVQEPHLVGLNRETVARQRGSWLASLFAYKAPRLAFSRSEQQLLIAAMRGKTDEELSNSLCISLSAVKKRWRAIYARVTEQLPELIPHQLFEDTLPLDRGKEKRRPLLAYLREHPEELRPISRKLLQTSSVFPGIHLNRELSPRHSSLLRSSRNTFE